METISPALADAHHLLRANLLEHLDAAEHFGRQDEWDEHETDRAHTLIDDLVTVIRGLLVGHIGNETGTCRKCGESWPCGLVATLHTLLKSPEREFHRILREVWQDTNG